MPSPAGCLKMQNKYEAIMVAAVGRKLAKATELGIKASWTSSNHLDALAEVIEAHPGEARSVLGECYNISAFQQRLAKKFAEKGHFQRADAKSTTEQVDDLLSLLAKETA